MAYVLVVEDEDDIRDLVEFALTRQGHTADGAGNGRVALDLINQNAYDVVVLDVGLPGLSGIEVAQQVALGHTAHRPRIVMLSAFGAIEDQRRGLQAGADHYLVKPAPLREVVRLVDDLVQRSEQHDQHDQDDQDGRHGAMSEATRSRSASASKGFTT